MASKYLFAIIDRETGAVIAAVEPRDSKQLVDEFGDRLATKGVGVFRPTKHVVNDAKTTLDEIIFELKAKIKPNNS